MGRWRDSDSVPANDSERHDFLVRAAHSWITLEIYFHFTSFQRDQFFSFTELYHIKYVRIASMITTAIAVGHIICSKTKDVKLSPTTTIATLDILRSMG